ncbi:hypothetical protein MSG28_005937 [Choristoneura fumiferana]|uniref:Uncharacterized protein n=1 Tax=Choristoneura fumiferana TaxID=7141 RepID=A0ACC0L133_CHOFU|nr:hypothetical protein MSG28_005937 [Choristoneura fumiferana]
MSKYITYSFVPVLLFLVLSLAESASTKEAETPKDDAKTKSEDTSPPADQDDMNNVDIMRAMMDCNETFRIEMSYLLALNESGSFPDETDRTPKCYIRCVLEMVEIASADGQFDAARAEPALSSIRGVRVLSDVAETAAACAADRNESCKCERSYQFIKCLMEMEIKMTEKS